MEFTKAQTNKAKGIAICLMFIHHLFTFNDRLVHGNTYIPLVPFFDLEKHIGEFGKISVFMFLFLSGYGLFLGYINSKQNVLIYTLIKLKDFYLTYWLYFLIFIPMGMLFFKDVTFWNSEQIRFYPDPFLFFNNFFALIATYNSEWWFAHTYVTIIIFLFPLYIKLIERNIGIVFIVSLVIFSITPIADFFHSIKFDWYGDIAFWQMSFAIGMIFAKLKLFSSSLFRAFDELRWIYIIPSLLLCLHLRTISFFGGASDSFITPFFIYFAVRAITSLRLSKVFAYLGKYSFQLWLIHSFFCYYYFQDIIFYPKWSPFIFISLAFVSLISVLAVEKLRIFLQLDSLSSTINRRLSKKVFR